MKEDKAEKFVKWGLKRFHIKVSEKTEDLLIQIFKFVIVGFTSTFIDFLFLYIFREFCKFSVLISNTLSFCISVVYNYIASVKWVYHVNKEKDKKRQFVTFVIFSAIGLLLNNLIMLLCTDFLNIYYMLSKAIATAIVMVFNFITRKLFLE